MTTTPNTHPNVMPYTVAPVLSRADIDALLAKLARGHISTQQEEYADLKRVLR